MAQRKRFLLRIDPEVYEALAKWAGDELRSANAQIDYLLVKALKEAGREPASRRREPPREKSGSSSSS